MGLRPRAVPVPERSPTSTDRTARLEVRLTVPTGKDADAACRALVHALARLAVSRPWPRPRPRRTQMRAAIYARFSTDRQDVRSLEDQRHRCGQRAADRGWSVVAVFTDAAMS